MEKILRKMWFKLDLLFDRLPLVVVLLMTILFSLSVPLVIIPSIILLF